MHSEINRKHIELFPNKRFLPKAEVVRLKEIVMHALGGEKKLVNRFALPECDSH